jgi:DNA-binding XRE family transcriptional regulator
MHTGQQDSARHVTPAVIATTGKRHRKLHPHEAREHREPRALPHMISPLLALSNAPSTVDAGLLDGDELRSIRKRLRLSQREMAQALCVSQRAISHYEAGARSVPVELYPALYTMLHSEQPAALVLVNATTLAILRVI